MKPLLSIFLFTPFFSLAQNSPTIDPFSLTSTLVIIRHDTTILGNATCFFIQKDSTEQYLVTNNHVIGQEYFVADYQFHHHDSLPSLEQTPNNIAVRLLSNSSYKFAVLQLYDNTQKPLFINFYNNRLPGKPPLDVSVIPLRGVNKIQISTPVLGAQEIRPSLLLYPSEDLFVVGFPENWGTTSLFPMWKKGSISSEPNLTAQGIYSFSIDATTRKGMSGSPVFFRSNSYTDEKKGYITGDQRFTFLVGIYSAQNFDLEVGTVTKLTEIFNYIGIPTSQSLPK